MKTTRTSEDGKKRDLGSRTVKKTPPKTTKSRPSQRSLGSLFEIGIPIYGMMVDVGLLSFEETRHAVLLKHETELDMKQYFNCCDGVLINLEKEKDHHGYVLLAIHDFMNRMKEDAVAALGVLSHECLHCATMVMTSRGIPVSEENDEAIAYLQEFIFEKILRKIGVKLVAEINSKGTDKGEEHGTSV